MWLLVAIALVLMIIIVIVFDAIGIDSILLMTLVFIPLMAGAIWLLNKLLGPDETPKHIVIDEKNETATLLQRSNISANKLQYEPVYSANYKFVPSETRYAGATVGGIHTGGFYNTEAYIHEYGGKKTEKSHVFVKDYMSNDVIEIKKIKLSGELLTLAKQDKRIKQFIVDDYISLRHKGKDTELTQMEKEAMKQAVLVQDKAMMYNITQRAFLAGYLDTSDVMYILSWIQGDNK